jgi:hypothetical protein
LNARLIAASIALVVIGSFIIFGGGQSTVSAQGGTTELQTVTAQVYENTANIRSIETELARIENSEISQNNTLAARGERLSHLETTVEAHEWILRSIGGIVIVLLFETGFRAIKATKKKETP